MSQFYKATCSIPEEEVFLSRDPDGLIASVDRRLKNQVAAGIVDALPLGQPTMLNLVREEAKDFRTMSTLIVYCIELRACRSMDVMIYPEPLEFDFASPLMLDPRRIPKVKPQPTFWQRITNHLKSLAAEVQYDGGYGDCE